MKTKLKQLKKMTWGIACVVLAVLAIIFVQDRLRSAQASQAATATKTKSSDSNYDIREELSDEAQTVKNRHNQKLNASQKQRKAQLASARQRAKTNLSGQIPGLEVQLSKTGSAEIVGVENGPRKTLTRGSAEDHEKIVRDFVSKNADLYGLTAQQAAQLKKISAYTNPNGNMSWVELRQEINGVPVFQGGMLGAMTRNGELLRTAGRLASSVVDSSTVTSNSTEAAAAVVKAAATIGMTINSADLVLKESLPDGTSFIFEPGPFADEIKVETVYFPLEEGLVAKAWSMVLWQETPAYYTIVDAESGDLLWRKNITNEQTQPATFSVYDGDSPSPLSPTNAFPGSGIQGAGIARTNFTLVSELPAFNNLGWITDGGNTTTGNNVDAGLDVVTPNGIDAAGRPTGSPARVFDFPYNPGPLGGDAPNGANYRAGAVTNLFFWSNRYHDRLYEVGFTEASRNFQGNNFGRGGAGNDFVRAEAQDFNGTNNANFSTPPDGTLPRMQMYLWPGPNPDRDGDLDIEIVIHELTHGTSNRLHSNASGLNVTISGGMGEGWSDFYARAILSSADENVDGIFTMGGYATNLAIAGYTDNYYYGIRRFPYAVKTNVGPNGKPHNPLTFADIDPNKIDLTDGAYARGPFGLGGRLGAVAVHNIGELWCMSLLEVRARIIHRMGYVAGNQRMMQLVTDAMKLDPVSPNLLDGRNSLLTADVAFGSEDALDIWAGFATRGMGLGASIVSATNHNTKESFDYPIPGMGAVTATDSTCDANNTPDVGEVMSLSIPLTNPLTQDLTGVSAQVVGGGTASYGTIASGATVSQNISYRIPTGSVCGSKLTVSVIVTSNLGVETKTFPLQLGTPTSIFAQNFDGVTAPALPAGWTTSTTGSQPLWVTSTTASDTAPNVASTTFAATTGINQLLTPSIALTSGNAQLTFRHSYNSEFAWDGGVLEISINGGAFTDIVDAGGSFETGGYNWALNRTADGNTNALQSRAAWTGNSGGFITTTANLPAAAAGQNIQLRFRAGSDSSTTVTNSHWRVDSIVLNQFQCASIPTTTSSVTATPTQYSDQTTLSATVSAGCTTPTGSVQFSVNGSPVGSASVNSSGIASLAVTINLPAGSYAVAASFVSSNPYYQNSSGAGTLLVSRENAVVTPSASNPTAVKVNTAGGTAGPITIAAAIVEESDGSPGNISNAVPVTITLSPVGPGSSYTQTVPSGSGGGVGGTLNVSATFTNVAVNVYDVTISIGGNYYTGSGNTVLAVYDPSLGFVTGGGTIIHNGYLANFGLNIKYLKNGNAQGSLLYIEHRPTGDVKVKSNALQTLSIAGNTGIALGKATLNGVGNYSFRATVVDNGEPGINDQFGLQLTSPGGSAVSDLTFLPITLTGGNIQVPKN